jgi:hypothetical protein
MRIMLLLDEGASFRDIEEKLGTQARPSPVGSHALATEPALRARAQKIQV